MIMLEAEATVTYTCWLTKEDEQTVREFALENDCSLNEAMEELWENDDINVYGGEQTESDCSTESVRILEERE